ncbi:IS1-like element transposase [Serratia sp. UGAL515B_01]
MLKGEQSVQLAFNGSGVRDTARVLKITIDIVKPAKSDNPR